MASFQGGSSSSAGSSGSGASAVNIIGCTASDTWIIDTDNASGNLYPQVTCAIDPSASAAIVLKASPKFNGSNSSIVTTTDWPDGNNWLVSASSTYNGWVVWGGRGPVNTDGWTSAAGSFNGTTGDQYWQIQYPQAVNVQSFSFAAYAYASAPVALSLNYSDNTIDWFVAQNYSISAGSYNVTGRTTISLPVVPSGSHRYWRVRITKIINNDCVQMADICMYTGFTAAGLRLASVIPVSMSAFKITLTDAKGAPLSAINIPIACSFYISLFKNDGGAAVNTGKYTLTLGPSNGSPGVIVRSN